MHNKIPFLVEASMAAFTIGSTFLAGTEMFTDLIVGVVVYFSSRFLYRSYGDKVYDFVQKIKRCCGIK